jgi:hypothetical protein
MRNKKHTSQGRGLAGGIYIPEIPIISFVGYQGKGRLFRCQMNGTIPGILLFTKRKEKASDGGRKTFLFHS